MKNKKMPPQPGAIISVIFLWKSHGLHSTSSSKRKVFNLYRWGFIFAISSRGMTTTKRKKTLHCLVQKYADHTSKFKQIFLPKIIYLLPLQLQSEKKSKMDTRKKTYT